ncbi:MAG: SRPBCC family protein [Streptosporangiaceae bacterium]
MTSETLSASTTIGAPAETIFGILADPRTHPAIDGTGWVREPLDGERLTGEGQIFRMAMYHDNDDHLAKDYQMANKVCVFEQPSAIAWQPGQARDGDGDLQFGGWIWRYDLAPAGSGQTKVTLSYDWSAVGPFLRQHIQFPPFGPEHLDNSLRHLADLATQGPSRA